MGRGDAKARGVYSQQLTADSAVLVACRSLLSTVDRRLSTCIFDRLQLPDQGPDLQLRLNLDRKLSVVIREPKDQVSSQEMRSFALGLDADGLEGASGRDDSLAALDLDPQGVGLLGKDCELDPLFRVELESAQIINGRERIESRVPEIARDAVHLRHPLFVIEFRQLISDALALDGVLLESERPKSLRLDPGHHVVADEEELGQKIIGQRREGELVDGASVPLGLFGGERQLSSHDAENRHDVM